jgi:hypothetical protein
MPCLRAAVSTDSLSRSGETRLRRLALTLSPLGWKLRLGALVEMVA